MKATTQRRLAAVAAPVLLAFSLTACGGGASGAPDDASVDEFCDVFLSSADVEDGGDVKQFGDDLADVGTPDDIDDDARNGFEVFVDAAQDVDDDASLEDIEDPDVSDDDENDVDAFLEYASTTCADAATQ